ncbi:EAL domain-containing protein [Achromobacter xylosoxidans]|uniref:bifunctional diguanylate cyclase/phosphodiesterase n=1 Tax=Alcaligenes xylosoxydans xylosoxydans TaxID=85698 RepID=UPI001F12A3F9|nr:EAL domain-containing protein [Achromobacter xylosoxidans]MDZ5618473.1 EAL domain-containing protein [Achromobacter xylosoxidans]MDZ5629394.1 EAL domain-containing protein [Achromobacter xylosoxidans]MDZ5689386.1 EAL domain-containing protein [Achromobacter xylosoxidans]
MSTLRRLILCTALLIAFILLGAQALGMLAAHRYLNTQLAQQGQAGASALAWALSHDAADDQDKARLADDLFAAGTYALVRITGENGDTQVERREPAPDRPDLARDWRNGWLAMEAPAATRPYQAPDGRRLGTVTVQADARLARDTLWQGGVRVIGLTLAAAVFWVLFAANLLRWIEARAAREIHDRARAQAPDGGAPGRPGELTDQALVDAQRQVAATVQEQNARIESLQSEIHRDAVTRLPNRKYFIDHFRQALADPAPEAGGHILMFRQRDLAQINRHLSRAFTDQWLRSSSDRLRKLVDGGVDGDMTLARISGSDFALLMPRTSAPQAGLLAERVRHELRSLRVPMDKHGWCRWALAMAAFTPGDNISDTLARLDHALMCAESADDDQIAPASQAADSTRIGEYSWHDALSTALEQHRFSLSVQPLADVSGALLHYEASLTLHDADGADPVPASIFMPPAVRLGLSAECDIQAIRLGLDWLYTHADALTVHVSLASLAQGAFLSRLERMLADRPAQASRLILEVDAAALVEHGADMRQLCQIVSQGGGRIGLSRLSQQFGAMEHLHEYPLSYVKLCGGFVTGILHSPGSQHLAATVVATAVSLRMSVYAEDVPDEATRAILEQIGVRAIRGAVVNFARAHDLAPDQQWVSS